MWPPRGGGRTGPITDEYRHHVTSYPPITAYLGLERGLHQQLHQGGQEAAEHRHRGLLPVLGARHVELVHHILAVRELVNVSHKDSN